MGMDLSYYEALMGGPAEERSQGATGGVWVVSPECALDDAVLRLIGKARIVADSLGAYVYVLLAGQSCTENAQPAVHGGADFILLASGVPSATDLADFFRPRHRRRCCSRAPASAARSVRPSRNCWTRPCPAMPPT